MRYSLFTDMSIMCRMKTDSSYTAVFINPLRVIHMCVRKRHQKEHQSHSSNTSNTLECTLTIYYRVTSDVVKEITDLKYILIFKVDCLEH